MRRLVVRPFLTLSAALGLARLLHIAAASAVLLLLASPSFAAGKPNIVYPSLACFTIKNP